MEPHLEEALYMEFPYLFSFLFDQYKSAEASEPHKSQIRTRSGWYKILYNLCLALNSIIAREGIDPKLVYFTTIKQKFGGLRVYMTHPSAPVGAIGEALAKATEESKRTCEDCGAVGELRAAWWVAVRCD